MTNKNRRSNLIGRRFLLTGKIKSGIVKETVVISLNKYLAKLRGAKIVKSI
jgi:hypothetical protein